MGTDWQGRARKCTMQLLLGGIATSKWSDTQMIVRCAASNMHTGNACWVLL